jgi:hypothetical protein
MAGEVVSGAITRRQLLTAVAGLSLGGGVVLDRLLAAEPARLPALGSQPPGLPVRQYAWDATLAHDEHGNPISPRFDRLLFFDVRGRPSASGASQLEAAMRTLECNYRWEPGGLLFTLGWGHGYFERVLGVSSPVEQARSLSDFELPTIDDYDVCLHVASDDEHRLAQIEGALVHGSSLAGTDGPLDLRPVLRWRETRTGFVGASLPAAHQRVGGIPSGEPVSGQAPLYMGFKSGYRRNQASEDAITIDDGPFTQATTMQVSRMQLRLESWYELLDERERVARMFAPQLTPAQVSRFTTDAASYPYRLDEAARDHGVVGHAQASACARRNGRPLILRRDFDSDDGGEASLSFVSLQRTIADFITTRTAMNAAGAVYVNPAITPTTNNGINEYIFVTNRANYLIPSRAQRSFPGLPEDRSAQA